VTDIRSVAGSNTVTWTAVPNAASYNVYRAVPRYGAAVPAGSDFGFAGNVTSNTFIDSNINIDFSQGPPVVITHSLAQAFKTITITNRGANFTGIPAVSFNRGGGGTGLPLQPPYVLLVEPPVAVLLSIGDRCSIIGDTSGAVFTITAANPR